MAKLTEDEFTKFYEAYYKDVFRVACSYLRRKADSEDVVQETFLRLFRKPPKDLEKLKPWLLKVAVHLALDLLRKRKKESIALSSLQTQTSKEANRSEGDILTLVSRLPEAYRKPIILHYYGEESVDQIGKTLHLTPSAVKKRLERGRELIRKELEGQHGSNR